MKKSIFKRFSVAAVAAVIFGVTLLSVVAVAAGPAIVENIHRIIIVPIPDHVIEDTERDISFSLELISFDYEVQPHHVSLEDAAKVAAEAIYDEFGFCLDGMVGYVTLLNNLWSGFIVYEELTRPSMGVELFHFLIDAVTGEVLYLAMNTPESPFLG